MLLKESVRRAAAALVVAGSLLVSAVFGLRSAVRPVNVYVIQGDSTGVVLTGPGVARRAEAATVPVQRRKGDRT